MNIVMMTNNYLPHIGGVARSVASFVASYQNRGHRVLVIAPHRSNQSFAPHVSAVPGMHVTQNQDFIVPLPIPGIIAAKLKEFSPDIIHAHHPFMLGSAALVAAARWNLPIVFTHHTMYEHYTHYTPADSLQAKHLITNLSIGYANLCDCVFAPTPSIASILRRRGVATRLEIVPTGVNVAAYRHGSGRRIRKRYSIPSDAFVVGHISRLAPEKNLIFLMRALLRFVKNTPNTHALIAGDGPMRNAMEHMAAKALLQKRFHFIGTLQNGNLINAYRAMDLFAFSSTSETQGLVLLESLAAGVPIVALDAPGSRDIIEHGSNGWLVSSHDPDLFDQALRNARAMVLTQSQRYRRAARHSAARYDQQRCADHALSIYESLLAAQEHAPRQTAAQRVITAKWDLWSNRLSSLYSAIHAP